MKYLKKCYFFLPTPLIPLLIAYSLSAHFLLAINSPKNLEPINIVLWVGGASHDFAGVTKNLLHGLEDYTNANIKVTDNPNFLLAIPSDRPDIILMFHNHSQTKGTLNNLQKKHLLQWVHEGTGVVALHSSCQLFSDWANGKELFGATPVRFLQSPENVEINIQNPSHPIVDRIPSSINMFSKPYSVKQIAKDCEVIATHKQKGETESYPAIWTRRFGQGRVVTILPGSIPQNYKIASFQHLIANSIDWANEKDPYPKKRDITKDFIVPDGFKVELIAEEPYLANPLTMTLDDQGNLYISNAHSYRRDWWLAEKQKFFPSNPIVRLTLDANDQLQDCQLVASGFDNPVLGMALKGNHLYYTNLNKLVHTQVDHKGRICDQGKILIRDQAKPWNPFGMYRLKFGMDDQLYMNIGDHRIKLSNATEKIHLRDDLGGSGISLRFNQDGTNLELINQGMRAPFTMDFDPFGRLWVISNGEPRCNVLINPVKGADYRFRKNRKRDFEALTGKHPLAPPVWETPLGAQTSVIPYYSDALPQKYWGKLFLVNWGRHGFPALLNEIKLLHHDGRGKIIGSEVFITAKEPLFRPTQMMVAPDGNFYVLDWFGKDDENDLTGRLLKISYTGKTSPPKELGLESNNHYQRKTEKERLLRVGPSALPTLRKYIESKNPVTACEALWVLRRCDWENRESLIKSALNHQNWRVRRLAVEVWTATNKQDDSFCRKMAQDEDPEVKMEAVFGLQDPTEICQILTEILPQGVADIQRLRYQAAIHLARHGSVSQIENLVKSENHNIRLTGLVALDEAMYTLSNNYEDRRLKEIPSLVLSLLNDDIALQEIVGIAQRWLTSGIHQKISLKLVKDLEQPITQESFIERLVMLQSIGLHKTTEVQALCLDKIKSFDNLMPDQLSPKQEKLLAILIEINGVAQFSDPIIKHMISEKKLNPSIIDQIVNDLSEQPTRQDLIKEMVLERKFQEDLRIKLLTAFQNIHNLFDEVFWKQMLLSSEKTLVVAALRLIHLHPNQERAVTLIRDIEKTIFTTHGQSLQSDLDFALSRDRYYDGLGKRVINKIASGNPSLGHQSFMSRTCYACHGPETPEELAPSLKDIGTQPNPYLVESILHPSKVVKTGYLVGDRSLMPAGLEKTMSEAELVDLIAYLKTL